MHVVVLVVVDEEEVDEEDDDDVEEEDVELVALTHVLDVENDEARGQPGPQAWPAAQHVRLAPLPHGVRPDGHPHSPRDESIHATPESQQVVPQGVVPFGQQHDVEGLEQLAPLAQHPDPHTEAPAGQVTALPRNGFSSAAPAATAAEAAMIFRAPRRDVVSVIR